MAFYIVVVLCCLSTYSFGQSRYSITDRKASKDTSCTGYYVSLAKTDIAEGHPVLLEIGGTAWHMDKKDTVFQDRYLVHYYISGCVIQDNTACMAHYNETVFTHLDSQYGKEWRKAVRPYVIGLKKYISGSQN